jgi:hypothetical protein
MKLVSNEAPSFPAVSKNQSALMESQSGAWGWLPALSLISAIGVLLVALAYEGGRISAQLWPQPLYWSGMIAVLLPIVMRLLSSKPALRERIALLIVLAISLYFVSYLQYPLHFSGYDEFSHWQTEADILATGHLFHQNPLLPISSFYPGLEIVTNALSTLTGLSVFVSGTILIGVVQLVFVLSLYLLYERFTYSTRIASIAAVLYMANPQYLFFDIDFSYEALALPLAIFILYVIACRGYARTDLRKGLTLVIWLGLCAIVITHHVTSYVLVAFLLLWRGTFLILWATKSFHQNRTGKKLVGPGGVALLCLILCLIWLIYTGDMAINYLSPHISSIAQQVTQILANERAPRQLFQNNSGLVIPLWERLLSYISVALILLGLPFGLFRIWQRLRTNALALAMAIGALGYPVGQALRLTPAGGETGNRTTEFVFVGVACVLAIGIVEFWLSHRPGLIRSTIIFATVGILCFGQIVLGTGQPFNLLPGPYLVSADSRSIEPEGITAAEWANSYLGPRQRVASDRDNTLLMATYAQEQVMAGGGANVAAPVAQVFTSLHFGSGVIAILQEDKIQYLVVDHRLSTSLPYVGTYFNLPVSGGEQITRPIDPTALAKFDGVQNVSRIFDSGDIVIYNVEAISNESSIPSTPGPSNPPLSQPALRGRNSYSLNIGPP